MFLKNPPLTDTLCSSLEAEVGKLTKPNVPHKPVQVKCNLPSYFKLWTTTQSRHHPSLLSWLEAIQPEGQTSRLGFMSAGGCPGSPTNLLGYYLGTSPLLSLSAVFLRPINKKFWIRYYYIVLLSVVFVPCRLVRLQRKIKQLSKPNLVWGIRTPDILPSRHGAALSDSCFAGAQCAQLPFTVHVLWPYLICFSVFHCTVINHDFLVSQLFNQYIKRQIR